MKKSIKALIIVSTLAVSTGALAVSSSKRPPVAPEESSMTIWETVQSWFDFG